MSKYDLITYIGRFQPFHIAHLEIVMQALGQAKFVHIIIGSANEPATIKNPFSFEERREMILRCFSDEEKSRLSFSANEDWFYDEDKWKLNVYTQVREIVDERNLNYQKVGLIGYDKDASSYYLEHFDQWPFVEATSISRISSTDIRESWYFDGEIIHSLSRSDHEFKLEAENSLPRAVEDYLLENISIFNPRIKTLSADYERIQAYKKIWAGTPYPVILNTVDSFVTQTIDNRPHILLVQRRDNNLFALPGGFLNNVNEDLLNGAKRELLEETGLDLSKYESTHVTRRFAYPTRSFYGRMITEVFPFDLDKIMSKHGRFEVTIKPDDDAIDALWVPIRSIKRSNMHDDHFQMIQKMYEFINQDPKRVA
jgi:bifunctional NMN adenylyltransferase/nudix hydrolase